MRPGLALVAALALLGGGCTEAPPDLPEGAELTPLTEEEVRDIQRGEAMQMLQRGVAAQMRLLVDQGRFTDDGDELDLPEGLVLVRGEEAGAGPREVSVQVCEGDTVAVLANTAQTDEVFAVKARGLEPHEDGEAVFSHYIDVVPECDPSDGPEEWPGGWFVSRQGLRAPVEEAQS